MTMEPRFAGFQLLGDSLLLRFAETILGYELDTTNCGAPSLGLCMPRQGMKQLIRRVRGESLVSKRVMVLIGTEDFKMGNNCSSLKRKMKRLLEILQEKAELITILTLPPVPRVERHRKGDHWARLESHNKFLKSLDNGSTIRVVDICPLFLKEEKEVNLSLFESHCGSDGNKSTDMVHWNKEGMIRVLDCLREQSWIYDCDAVEK